MAGDKDSPSHTTTVTTTASNPAFRGKYIKTDSGWVETTEDIYEKIKKCRINIVKIEDVAQWLHAIYYSFDASYRPVPIDRIVLGFPNQNKQNPFLFEVYLIK